MNFHQTILVPWINSWRFMLITNPKVSAEERLKLIRKEKIFSLLERFLFRGVFTPIVASQLRNFDFELQAVVFFLHFLTKSFFLSPAHSSGTRVSCCWCDGDFVSTIYDFFSSSEEASAWTFSLSLIKKKILFKPDRLFGCSSNARLLRILIQTCQGHQAKLRKEREQRIFFSRPWFSFQAFHSR